MYNRVNPIRAGIVDKPEDYRWSTLGYLIQRGNKDGLIGLNLGMHEWNEFNPTEIIRKYREFVYETGAVGRSQKPDVRGQGDKRGIDMKIVEQERKKNYRLSRTDVFRHRCRYFTDSGIIGSPVKQKNRFPGAGKEVRGRGVRWREAPAGFQGYKEVYACLRGGRGVFHEAVGGGVMGWGGLEAACIS